MTSTARAYVPDHLLDLDEWDALDREETYRHAELVEGVLVMAPSPLGTHQRIGARLAEYAEAGITHYDIVDPEPLTRVEFALHDGRYDQVAEHHGTATLALGVTIDLEALAALR